MFATMIAPWEIAVRTVLVYGAVLIGLRLAGKREIGQMTPFDLVVILLVANAVQNAMVGPDSSLTGGIISAGTLVSVNYLVSRIRDRVPWLRRAIEGQPTLLIRDGAMLEHNLAREHVDREEVLMALREHGIDEIGQVRAAILETDGSISVVQATEPTLLHTKRRVRRRQRP